MGEQFPTCTFFLLLSLKSPKSSLILIVLAKIFRPSNGFAAKLIHAAAESESSRLNILIPRLKSLKPFESVVKRVSAERRYASFTSTHQQANDELHFD